ncbi:MAG: hypothetical protein ACQEQL_05050 [Pseudomonadota bacterium]
MSNDKAINPPPPVSDTDRPPLEQDISSTPTGTEVNKSGGMLGRMLGGNKKPATSDETHAKFLKPALPVDLVGGEVPYLAGREDETVWNAAAQACGTERVHYCYSITGNRCWYLATPSSAMANIPDTWCPLAAALPGNSEHWDKETVYLYEQDGSACALRWDPETGRMQVFLGAARTIMPRIQSLEASFVTINPDVAKPVPWKNRSLNQEALSRNMTKWLFLSGLGVTLAALFYWFISFTMAGILRPNLEEAQNLTQEATFNLMREASNIHRTNITENIARINELSMELSSFGGQLIKYEVNGDSVEWFAVVPRAMEGDISRLGAKAIGIDEEQRGYLRIRGTR